MAYTVYRVKRGGWGLLYRLDKGKGGQVSRAIRPHEEEFKQLGLRPEMTIAEAKECVRVGQLEAKKKLRDRRRHEIATRVTAEQEIASVYLPDGLVKTFEETTMPRRKLRTAHWKAARRYIIRANLNPSKWYDEVDVFYRFFEQDARSPDYSRRILRILNEYGWEYCKQFTLPWRDLPLPRGHWYDRIRKAYKAKLKTRGRHFDCPRLHPDALAKAEHDMKPEQWRWLYVALWFGLRPEETNELTSAPEKHWVSQDPRAGVKVLTVLQPKVDDKPKHIPILFPEQERALEFIAGRKLEKPLVKTARRHFGAGIRLYSCRKGFVNLMDERGRELHEISAWLGHENTDTTRRFYWDIQRTLIVKK
jgi:hypothetical protein